MTDYVVEDMLPWNQSRPKMQFKITNEDSRRKLEAAIPKDVDGNSLDIEVVRGTINSNDPLGNHLHTSKTEYFYFQKGRGLLEHLDLATGELHRKQVEPGSFEIVLPFEPHRLVKASEEPLVFVHVSDELFDPKNTVPYKDMIGLY